MHTAEMHNLSHISRFADLVMLCLASHELHCVLLREQIIFALHERDILDKRNRRRLRPSSCCT